MLGGLARWLFDPSGLTPRGFCLLWEPGLLWLNALADLGIGSAYFAISLALFSIIRRRSDVKFRPMVLLFATFVLLCGIGHWLDLLTLWVPAYGVEGLVKAVTAASSIVTAVTVWKLMPRILSFRSPAQFRKVEMDLRNVRRAERQIAAVADEASRARDALVLELSRREAMEKELHESEERFRLLLQSNITEAFYLLAPDGTVETWNTGAEKIKGYTPEEIIGQNFSLFFTPEDRANGEPARILATVRDHGHVSGEVVRVRKGGDRFLAHVSIDAVFKHDGALRGFVEVTRDITNARVEEAQRAIIIEASPNGIMIVNESGVITLANSQTEQMFGYADGELVGQPVELLVPDTFRAAHHAMRSRFTSGQDAPGMPMGREFTGRRRDGSAVSVEVLLGAVKTPTGRVVVVSLFDATEKVRRAAEKQEAETRQRLAAAETNANLDRLARHLGKARDRAEQANQAKTRFLAAVTHELRTPLHGILGYAELLSIEGGLNQTQSERLEVMMALGQHLLGMINGVLDMSQIEANQVDLQPAEFDVSSLVRACLDVIRPAAEAKGLTVIHASTGRPRLVADPIRLRQVLINLLGNAVKFTLAGTIEVRFQPTGGGSSARLEVLDTGPGIPATNQDKIFQSFERLNAAAVAEVEGTGLGLAIASRLTHLMGGRIGYNDNPGGGSVFWLELPVSVATSGDVGSAAPRSQVATRRLRVLVADDEFLNRSIASRFLHLAGHEVVCVDDGAAAVAAAATGDYDVILMDVRMPDMNGMEATRRIRALPAPHGTVRVVAVTAQAFAQQIEMVRAAGMDSHVSKPFTQAVLLAALEDVSAAPGSSAPANESPGAAIAETKSEYAEFDRIMFQDIAESLPDAELAGHMRTLIARCEALLAALRDPLMPARELVDDVHRLAGGAGTFGFLSLPGAAREFEFVADADAADTTAVAGRLAAAIDASLTIIRQELLATAMVAT
jgi:PAS domain S-box-containing protein